MIRHQTGPVNPGKEAMDPLPVMTPERPVVVPHPPQKARSAVDRHLWEIVAVKDVLWTATVVGLLWAVYELRSIFFPIFIAVILAYLANPIIRMAERRWSFPRPLSVSLLLLLFSAATAALIIGIGPLVTDQVQTLVKKMPGYVARLNERLGGIGSLSGYLETTLISFKEDPFS